MSRLVPITQDGLKSKKQKKDERKYRSMVRRAKRKLERRGLRGHIHYDGFDYQAVITRYKQYECYDLECGRPCGCINLNQIHDIMDNKLRIYDWDNNRLFQNLEEFLREQLILKLSGLEK